MGYRILEKTYTVVELVKLQDSYGEIRVRSRKHVRLLNTANVDS
jgi:hypothetical protein